MVHVGEFLQKFFFALFFNSSLYYVVIAQVMPVPDLSNHMHLLSGTLATMDRASLENFPLQVK